MRPNAVMAVMARRAGASALLALAMAGPAGAGDRALADFLGFSEDGRYFAFEEFGIQDGSGFPYSTIYVIDLAADAWVPGSPYRFRVDDESVPLDQARQGAAAMAAETIAGLGITEPPDVIALNGDGEISDGLTLRFAQPGYLPGETGDEHVLTLDVFDADSPEECAALTGAPAKGFALALVNDSGMRELHRDTGVLPRSRGCVTGYRLYAVAAPQYADPARTGVAIVSTYPFGFEGPDRRFLAVPIAP